MDRQRILRRSEQKFHFVLAEAAASLPARPPDVMAGQTGHLMSMTTLPTMRVGINRFHVRLPVVVPTHGFDLYDDKLIFVELLTAVLHVTQTDEVQAYERVFAKLAKATV